MNDDRAKKHEAMVAWIESNLNEVGCREKTTIDVVKRALLDYALMSATELEGIKSPELLVRIQSTIQNEVVRVSPVITISPSLQLQQQLAEWIPRKIKSFLLLDQAESDGFYKNALLPQELLEDWKLQKYVEAALFENGKHSENHLDFLWEQQELWHQGDPHGDDDSDDDCDDDDYDVDPINIFNCIIASSGTGKTQLAATAALTYKKATTVYLFMGSGPVIQRFYQPHQSTSSGNFKRTLMEFLRLMNGGDGYKATTATIIANWAKCSDDGTSLFVRMLYHLLLQKPFRARARAHGSLTLPPCTIKLADLKREIREQNQKFLVFLDEVPVKTHADFVFVTCLRDTLRYLGIAPILMSTHTGAQDHVGTTSRQTITDWTCIISSLPEHKPAPQSRMLFPTERPLVLHIAMQKIEKGISHAVKKIQRDLQKKKSLAWTTSPALQLVQLFGNYVKIDGKCFSNTHNLVGHHFGSLLQKSSATRYSTGTASTFAQNISVAPVCARTEPLLYLALVTWNETMLVQNANVSFPIVDSSRNALTVRGAFNACSSDFIPNISNANLRAQKLDGDMLEVLVHASLTLASMKTSNDDRGAFLPGTSLKHYIPLVRELMTGEYLRKLPPTPKFFDKLSFDWPVVPALGGADSGLPTEVGEMDNSKIGSLVRPADGAMVDGQIFDTVVDGQIFDIDNCDESKPFMSVECKNFIGGVDSTILKNVFKRIKTGIKCSLIFVSKLNGVVFQQTNLEVLKKECFSTHHNPNSVTVVLWEAGKEPCFLKAQKKVFKAKKTSLLVVIITVEAVNADIGRKRKLETPPCANSDNFTSG